MEAWRCPNCDASTVIPGHPTTGEWTAIGFLPNGTHRCPTGGVKLTHAFFGCWSCGHVWTSLAPEELRALIATYGREVARQRLEAPGSGREDGLPDCTEARAAVEGVAEIDALVLAGRQREATRRYRELTRTSWDRALDAVRGWEDLKRAQKLALFGWRPKAKSQSDESPMRDHPMRDRWLDG